MRPIAGSIVVFMQPPLPSFSSPVAMRARRSCEITASNAVLYALREFERHKISCTHGMTNMRTACAAFQRRVE